MDLKDVVAQGLLASGIWRLLMPARSRGFFCVIVNFHSIVDDDFPGLRKGPSVHTPVEAFERFIREATRILSPISLDRLTDHIDSNEALPGNCLAITFDDGFRNNLSHAAPILEKYRCPATVFLPVDYIGSDKVLPMDRVSAIINQTPHAELTIDKPVELQLGCDSRQSKIRSNSMFSMELKKRPAQEWPEIIDHVQERAGLSEVIVENPMLTWEEAARLMTGPFSVGSHGCTHRLMTALSDGDAVDELVRSRDTIEERLGVVPRHFAYPNGRAIDFDDRLRNAAKEAGYRSVLSCERTVTTVGGSGSFHLGRFGMVGRPAHSLVYLIRSAARQLS